MAKEHSSAGESLELVVRDGKTGEVKQHIVCINGFSIDITELSRAIEGKSPKS